MIIELNPVEPAPIGLRHPVGVDLELDVQFVALGEGATAPAARADITGYNPQLVLISRSNGVIGGYDIEIVYANVGQGHVSVPGVVLNDRRDFTMEVYRRDADGVPIALLARGVLRVEGEGYGVQGPLGPMTYPTVQGEPGPAGPTGQRGSIWLSGNGDPTYTAGLLDGDMYLDGTSGNVWRWTGTSWALT